MTGFVEVNLFGVYVAPISVIMVVAWVVTIGLRRIAVGLGIPRRSYRPCLSSCSARSRSSSPGEAR
jgi:hypothetical protein